MLDQIGTMELFEIKSDEKAEFVVTFNLYRGIADYAILMRSSKSDPFRGIEKNIEKIVKRCLESIKRDEMEDI